VKRARSSGAATARSTARPRSSRTESARTAPEPSDQAGQEEFLLVRLAEPRNKHEKPKVHIWSSRHGAPLCGRSRPRLDLGEGSAKRWRRIAAPVHNLGGLRLAMHVFRDELCQKCARVLATRFGET
jgi:hypothetical protein